jgi:hypothetical protein
MKSTLSSGIRALLLLAPFSALVHSFPTAENFAKLAQRGVLEADVSVLSAEELHASLLKIKEKRLLFDPLTEPIDGWLSLV